MKVFFEIDQTDWRDNCDRSDNCDRCDNCDRRDNCDCHDNCDCRENCDRSDNCDNLYRAVNPNLCPAEISKRHITVLYAHLVLSQLS